MITKGKNPEAGMALRRQFGNRLQRLRQVEGMTQQDLAEAASVSVEYVSKLERGLASPSFGVLDRLCSALRTQPANLFLFTVDRHEPEPTGSCRSPIDAHDAIGLDGFISGVAFWSRDIPTDRHHFSISTGRLLGYAPDEFAPETNTFLKHFEPQDRKQLIQAMRLHDAGIQTPPMRLRLRRKDGSLRQCIAISEITSDAQGKPAMANGTILDVTELMDLDIHLGRTHKRLEDRVRERTEHLHQTIRSLGEEIVLRKRGIKELTIYRQMVENSSDRMCFLDTDFVVRKANKAAAEFYGLRIEDMTGMAIDDLVDRDAIVERLKKNPNQALENGPMRFQFWQKHGKHGPRYQDVAFSPCRDKNGEIMGLATSVRDLTDLEQAKQAAEKANRAKSEFMATMSHELRTPLNGVLGMLQLLERSVQDEAQRECVDTALASGRSLLAIMNDILDLSRVETGKLEIRPIPVDPRRLADEALASAAPMAAEKALRLEQVMADNVPPLVLSDPVRLRQILVNLLENAVKFTDSGHVRLDVDMVSGEHDRPMLKLTVSDTGMGIPEQQMRRIFEPFIRGKAHASNLPGTGLGLAIVQRLALLLGGRVDLSSRLGQGTTVAVRVDAPATSRRSAGHDEPPHAGPSEPGARSLRVLVVDDDPMSRMLMHRFLEICGHRAATAANGPDALELLRNEHFHCVLMDVEMPGMDGPKLARYIHGGKGGPHADVPIIALTAHALAGDRERFMQDGMDDYLSKPVDMSELEAALGRIMDRISRATPR